MVTGTIESLLTGTIENQRIKEDWQMKLVITIA